MITRSITQLITFVTGLVLIVISTTGNVPMYVPLTAFVLIVGNCMYVLLKAKKKKEKK